VTDGASQTLREESYRIKLMLFRRVHVGGCISRPFRCPDSFVPSKTLHFLVHLKVIENTAAGSQWQSVKTVERQTIRHIGFQLS
jgi:hypothetical protein